MNITFLFGNGFDIGLGMPTKFEDFYKVYCENQKENNKNIQEFKKVLKEWLNLPDEEKRVTDWADFEKTFGAHSLDFQVVEKQKYLERFRNFVDELNLYLEKVEKYTVFENTDAIVKVVNQAIENFKKIRRADAEEIDAFYRRFGGSKVYNFATFNYTTTVDFFYEALKVSLQNQNGKDAGRLVHVHGYIEEAMIVGVNDPSQISKPEFSADPEVIETLVKPQQNMISRTGHEKDLKTLIDNSNVICVYGMSIGDTDKLWWDYISKWLAVNDLRILVILQYDKKYNKRLPHVQSQYIKPVLEKFLSFSSLPDEKKQKITNRIFIDFNNSVFAMNAFDVDKYEKDKQLAKKESLANDEKTYNEPTELLDKYMDEHSATQEEIDALFA